MKTCALLMLGGLALAGTAAAEPLGAPAPGGYDGLPPDRIVAIVRQSGFDPMGRPVRNGDLYVLRALDPNDIEYRLVIDARTGRTVSLRQIAMPGPYQPAPAYGRNGGAVFGRIFGPSDDGYGAPRPPRDVPHAAPRQDTAAIAPPPKSTSAVPPLPRPRPYYLDATGSIPVDAPKAFEPPKAPASQTASAPPTVSAPQAAPAATAPEPKPASEPAKDNGGASMPPVAPLD